MEGIQTWFAPLLWVLATITAILAFIRLCKPVWAVFTAPKTLMQEIQNLKTEMNTNFTTIYDQIGELNDKFETLNKKIIKEDSICLSLLHSEIIQIYQKAKWENSISDMDYYRACELYKQNGNSQYIDGIMKVLQDLHQECAIKEDQKGE